MAGGLNKKFLADPVKFLRKQLISVHDSFMVGTGIQRVGFEANRERTLLKPFIGTPEKHQHPFECYFLKALPNQQNPGVGFATTTARFCFTSTLSGCQFLIYGNSKYALTIEHNNDLAEAGNYDGYANVINGFAATARVHNGAAGMYDITADDVGNVVGILGQNGWNFYFQKIAINSVNKKKEITVTQIL